MYLVKVEIRASPIDGKGVFALEDIRKDSVVWKFVPGHDKTITQAQFEAVDEATREELKRVAYLSRTTGRWVFPPDNDPARYTNHSKENNLSVLVNEEISEEPLFYANRDITAGEELINDYGEFDDFSESVSHGWLK